MLNLEKKERHGERLLNEKNLPIMPSNQGDPNQFTKKVGKSGRRIVNVKRNSRKRQAASEKTNKEKKYIKSRKSGV